MQKTTKNLFFSSFDVTLSQSNVGLHLTQMQQAVTITPMHNSLNEGKFNRYRRLVLRFHVKREAKNKQLKSAHRRELRMAQNLKLNSVQSYISLDFLNSSE
jgi:hypothetical protein